MIEVLETLAGEAPSENEPIHKFLKKKMGLPIATKMLRKSVRQLTDSIDNEEFRKSLVMYLADKLVAISSVISENELVKVKFKERTGTYRTQKGKEIKYFYNVDLPLAKRDTVEDSDSTSLAAWVPMNIFP